MEVKLASSRLLSMSHGSLSILGFAVALGFLCFNVSGVQWGLCAFAGEIAFGLSLWVVGFHWNSPTRYHATVWLRNRIRHFLVEVYQKSRNSFWKTSAHITVLHFVSSVCGHELIHIDYSRTRFDRPLYYRKCWNDIVFYSRINS